MLHRVKRVANFRCCMITAKPYRSQSQSAKVHHVYGTAAALHKKLAVGPMRALIAAYPVDLWFPNDLRRQLQSYSGIALSSTTCQAAVAQ